MGCCKVKREIYNDACLSAQTVLAFVLSFFLLHSQGCEPSGEPQQKLVASVEGKKYTNKIDGISYIIMAYVTRSAGEDDNSFDPLAAVVFRRDADVEIGAGIRDRTKVILVNGEGRTVVSGSVYFWDEKTETLKRLKGRWTTGQYMKKGFEDRLARIVGRQVVQTE